MADMKIPIVGISAICLIGLILLVILLPMSFSYLDYHQYGFARRRTTGNVDTTKVYSGGRYLVGPDFEFKRFDAAAHFVYFSHIPIFTLDNLQVNITVELQYFLIKEDLKLLHDSYEYNYPKIIVSNAKDALKNAVTKFDTDEFISNRSVIQQDLYYGVRQRLSGKCCIPGCKKAEDCKNCQMWEICDPKCKPRETCTKDDKGFFAEVRYLELLDIDIPFQVNERKLLSLIRELEKEKEESIKTETIVRKSTDLLTTKIKNEAKELVEQATAQYNFIINQAEINSSMVIETVHNEGMTKMIKELGLQGDKLIASINYLRALKEHEKVKYSIDFNTLITNTK